MLERIDSSGQKSHLHYSGHEIYLYLAVWLSHAGHQDKLGVAETKLLHTLHWMLLEAPQDCNNDQFGGTDRGSSWAGSSSAFIHQIENQGSPGQPCRSSSHDEEENNRRKIFQNSMATVELFVFLFAPLVHRIKVSRKLTLHMACDRNDAERASRIIPYLFAYVFEGSCSSMGTFTSTLTTEYYLRNASLHMYFIYSKIFSVYVYRKTVLPKLNSLIYIHYDLWLKFFSWFISC